MGCLVTENKKLILKRIGKVAAYTAITGGAYVIARGALSLLLKKIEPKAQAKTQAAPNLAIREEKRRKVTWR